MSTDTATLEQTRTTTVLFSSGQMQTDIKPKMSFKKSADGTANILVVSDIPVFRTGTFRDSMGYQATYEGLHIDQMVSHYTMLRDRAIFADVPVRDGHPGFLVTGTPGNGKVVGYHTGLTAEKRVSNSDGKEYTFLLAEYEILDPEAQAAIQSGLWRNRSAEIGRYVTNDEAEFWPVYMGVAYVDIPAVEGLNSFSKESNVRFMMEEESMGTTPETPTLPVAPKVPSVDKASETEVSDHSAAASLTVATARDAHAFTINGVLTTSFSEVQKYINGLERDNQAYAQAVAEAADQARTDFVNSLAEQNRIPATLIEKTIEFAKGLSAEAYESWKDIQSEVPTLPIFGNFGQGADGNATPSGTVDERADRVDTLTAIVSRHRQSNMSADKIVELPSYKELITLKPDFKL